MLVWVTKVSFLSRHWFRLQVNWNYEEAVAIALKHISSVRNPNTCSFPITHPVWLPYVSQSDLYISDHRAMEKAMRASFNQFSTLTDCMTVTPHTCVKVHFDEPIQQLCTDVISCHSCYRQVVYRWLLIVSFHYSGVVWWKRRTFLRGKTCSGDRHYVSGWVSSW